MLTSDQDIYENKAGTKNFMGPIVRKNKKLHLHGGKNM